MTRPDRLLLLDVNLLISLAWPNHVHHVAAQAWFRTIGLSAWATTPITEVGFVRVSSNRSAILTAVSPAHATELLERLRQVPGHKFLADEIPLVVGDHLPIRSVVTFKQVTDAHLIALARRHGAALATLDRGAVALAGGEGAVLVPTA